MSVCKWRRVTVVGCGLIGASFALAIRSTGACVRLAGWDVSPAVLDEALRRGIIDEVDGSFAGRDVSVSDLVYLAMPVKEIIAFLRERWRQVKPGAVVTDAGSTKQEICRAAREHFSKDRRFVGGHPIAGSHLHGLAHARASLFSEAPYILISDERERDRQALSAVKETIGLMGARVTLMTALEHDRAMALMSHLPQLVSSALAAIIQGQPDAGALNALSGAGYRDMTRLAASSWAMWRDILATNPAQITAALDEFVEKLAAVRDELRLYSLRADSKLSTTRSLFEHAGAQQTCRGS